MRRTVGIKTICSSRRRRKNWWGKFQLGLILLSSTFTQCFGFCQGFYFILNLCSNKTFGILVRLTIRLKHVGINLLENALDFLQFIFSRVQVLVEDEKIKGFLRCVGLELEDNFLDKEFVPKKKLIILFVNVVHSYQNGLGFL